MILIADDDPLTRMATGFVLEALGVPFVQASNGREAVTIASERVFDAVLMDIEMRVMDGRAALTAIRSLPSPGCDVPVIALTGHDGQEIVNTLMALGFTAVLSKPITPKRLLAALEPLLGARAVQMKQAGS